MKTRVRLLVLSFGLLLTARASAQMLDPSFVRSEYFQEGYVRDAIQQANGKWVVLGNFDHVDGAPQASLARFNADGSPDQVFNAHVAARLDSLGSCTRVLNLPNGQLLCVSDKQLISGALPLPGLLRLNADGTIDHTFSPSGMPTQYSHPAAAVQPDGKVIVTWINLVPGTRQITRLLPSGLADAGYTPPAAGMSVGKLITQPDGKLLVLGGYFNNGLSRQWMYRLDTNGTLDASFQALSPDTTSGASITDAVVQPDGNILITGGAATAPGRRGGLMRLLPSGSVDTSFELDAALPAVPAQSMALQPSGKIVVWFGENATNPAQRLVRLNADGSLDTGFSPGTGPDPDTYLLPAFFPQPDGRLLLGGGNMRNFNGQRRTLALLQANGTLDNSFAPLLQQRYGADKVLEQPDGKLLVLGDFNMVGTHLTDGVARLQPNGAVDPTFAVRRPAGRPRRITLAALQPNGQLLYVDGQGNFGRLNADGSPDLAFAPPFTTPAPWLWSGGILALKVQPDGKILVGGTLQNAAGTHHLLRLQTNGSLDATFAPSPTTVPYPVSGIVLESNGSLTCFGGDRVYRLQANGSPDPTFQPVQLAGVYKSEMLLRQSANQYVVAKADSAILYKSAMARVGNAGVPDITFRTPLVSYWSTTPSVPVSTSGPATGVHAMMAQADGKIVLAGDMVVQYGQSPFVWPRYALMRLNPNGQPDPTFDVNFMPAATGTIPGNRVTDAFLAANGAIVVAGQLTRAGQQPVSGVVRLLPAGTLAAKPRPTAPATDVYPNPTRAELRLRLDAAARPRQVQLHNALGQVVLTQPATQPTLTLDVRRLPAGVYLLRIDYANGPVTRRVVVQ